MATIGDSAQDRIVTGIDLVNIANIQASVMRFGEKFLKRIFTESELEYCFCDPALASQRLATRFAAKEAMLKVLLQEQDGGIGWRQIEICQADSRPHATLHGKAFERARQIGLSNWSISLSHEDHYASAIVVGIKNFNHVDKYE